MRTIDRRGMLLAGLLLLGVGRGGRAAEGVPQSALAAERLDRISARYLGTPYKLDCLGEGKGPDPDPLFTRKYADCQTLVEQVLSEALAPYLGGLEAADRKLRYFHGEVRLENRFHYCLPDWLANPFPVRDVTADLGDTHLATIRRHIDRPALLASRGGEAKLSPTRAEDVETRYVPRERVLRTLSRIPDGSIVLFVTTNPHVLIGHMGLLFRKEGTVVLRQASQTRKKVIDEPLTVYLKRAPRSFIGIKVLAADVTGLTRAHALQ